MVFVVVGAISMVCGFTFVLAWTIAGERQALRIKEAYVQAILRQVRMHFLSLLGKHAAMKYQ